MMDNKNAVPVKKEQVVIAEDPAKAVVGFWSFLGLGVLLAVPVVGFVACIVMMFAPKNRSIKNYARASMVCRVALVAVLVLVSVLLVTVVGGMVLPIVNRALNVEFDNVGEVVGLAVDVAKKDYSAVLARYKEPIVETVGEEYEPLIDLLSQEEYNELIGQALNGEYEAILQDVEDGRYDELLDELNKDVADDLLEMLKEAEKGEIPEELEALQNFIPRF